MRVVDNLRRVLEAQLPEVHVSRMRALLVAVGALLRGGVLTLTMLGRSTRPGAIEKHQIKRIDRLLGNPALQAERIDFFAAVAHLLFAKGTRPVILIDWTEATVHRHCVLYAAVAFQGRAVPIYTEAHPINLLSNTKIEKKFIARLAEVIPVTCRPVLVMDAGFRPMMWSAILRLGWDFVVRVRSGITLAPPGTQTRDDEAWRRSESFFALAKRRARSLGTWLITKDHRLSVEVVVFDGRSRRARRPMADFRRRQAEKNAAKAAHQPWLLVTSLQESASVVTKTYAKRMQIEETLRDQKNARFGWSLEHSGCRSTARLDLLLLIGALASLVALLVGLAGEAARLHHRFQANTRRTRRVLSLHTLGRRLLISQPSQLPCRIAALLPLLVASLAWIGS